MAPPTGILQPHACAAHDPGPGHPESRGRHAAVSRVLEDLLHRHPTVLARGEARPATREEILRCHTDMLWDLAQREIRAGRPSLSTGDTGVNDATWDAALAAAGAACVAVEQVCGGKWASAFCAGRPPGHHATASRAMGFCVFNHIAIAARHAQAKCGIKRVAIFDWDVHHGNGTQDIFYEDGTVYFTSTHQSPWYPGTGAADEVGEGDGLGTTFNVPLPAGSGRKEILGAWEDRVRPAWEKFQPELVMISAGFDSRLGDPLGGFTLSDQDFADLTRSLVAFAREHCGGRVVSVLEGGYDLVGLASACRAHVAALAGVEA